MSKIKLTQGYEAIVDPIDHENLSKFRWHILRARDRIYAARCLGKNTNYFLHHEIAQNMKLEITPGKVIGFANGDGLDCRRDNIYLRDKNDRMTGRSFKEPKSSKSGYRGVSPVGKKYRASIGTGEKRKHLGVFVDPIEAAMVYDKAAIEIYGDNAILNFS